jgi:polar amino acid transport system substrate-binding protein
MVRLLLASLALLVTLPASALTFVTEENPPLNFTREGQVAGLATGVLREALKRANLQVEFRVLPWAGAFAAAQQSPDVCVYSTVRNAEREKLLRWVGPIVRGEWSLFGREGFPADMKKLDQLKTFRVGALNDARAGYLRSRGFSNLVLTESNLDLAAMLTADKAQLGKIDLWLTQTLGAAEVAKRAGIGDLKPVFVGVMSQDYYLACHPRVAEEAVQAISAALAEMRKDGTFRKLVSSAP